MPYTLIIKEEALLDAITAYIYYEQQQAGLGERFLAALQKRYNDLSKHPFYYSYISEDPKQVLRDVMIEKFPYVLIYEIEGNQVIVYAVYNTNQKPVS